MKILNFGSVNIDLVYAVKEFVKPGETIASLSLEKHSGGKGFNQSVALAKAGMMTYHAGRIGADGMFLKKALEDYGAQTSHLQVVDMPTGHAMIQVNDQGENCIILYPGANAAMDEVFCDQVLRDFGEEDVLVLQNEINHLAHIVDKAYAKGMHIALNPSPMNAKITAELLEKVTWLFVNAVEAQSLTGEKEPALQMAVLKAKYPKAQIILTLGKEGAWYQTEDQLYKQVAYRVEAVDTTAAGDTFTGFFLAMLLQGKMPNEALEIATKAAALSVTKKGAATSIPTLEEVCAFKGN